MSVDINPDTTLAEIRYDPARCHARDLLEDLKDDGPSPAVPNRRQSNGEAGHRSRLLASGEVALSREVM